MAAAFIYSLIAYLTSLVLYAVHKLDEEATMAGYSEKITRKIFRGRQSLKAEMKEIGSSTKILIYGLGSSGKSTIRDKLYEQSESEKYWKLSIGNPSILYKVFGRSSIRAMSRHVYMDVEAVVFVIDSSRTVYRHSEKYYLQRTLTEEKVKDCPFALVANKQDLCDGFSADEIAKDLGEDALKGRNWKLFPATAKTGEGIKEVFDWLTEQIGGPEAQIAVDEDNKEVDETDSMFLSSLVAKFKKTFFFETDFMFLSSLVEKFKKTFFFSQIKV